MTTGPVYKWLLVLLCAAYGLTALASGNTESPDSLFNQLMEESGLALTPPPGFTHIKPVANPK